MKTKLYINGLASISAQPENVPFYNDAKKYHQNIIPAVLPDFKKVISGMALRRMSKAVKMGVIAAKQALDEAHIIVPDAIITGTGQGCLRDTENFLELVLKQNGEMLAPTSFIQSTHNTVGGQIALNLQCTSYNVTYSQNSGSFESALIDGMLQLQEQPDISVLVGGVDEISEKITPFLYLDGQLKEGYIVNLDLLKNRSPGSITSEGAHFFSISGTKNSETYAELIDVELFNAHSTQEVSEKIRSFLKENELEVQNLDLVMLGNNGDSRYDHFYHFLQKDIFKHSLQLAFKHLVGDYNTVSGYALWLGCKVFKSKQIPEVLKLNKIQKADPKRLLIYNQYLGEEHSLILLGS